MFTPSSRYAHVPTAVHTDREGRARPYVLPRPIPSPPAPTRQRHEMADGERLDHVAARTFGDAEQFWRICDVNAESRPDDLEVPGRRITIPLVLR
jgi:hypothetical protein